MAKGKKKNQEVEPVTATEVLERQDAAEQEFKQIVTAAIGEAAKEAIFIPTGLTFMDKKMVLIADGKGDEVALREFKRIAQVHEYKFKMIHNGFARAK